MLNASSQAPPTVSNLCPQVKQMRPRRRLPEWRKPNATCSQKLLRRSIEHLLHSGAGDNPVCAATTHVFGLIDRKEQILEIPNPDRISSVTFLCTGRKTENAHRGRYSSLVGPAPSPSWRRKQPTHPKSSVRCRTISGPD